MGTPSLKVAFTTLVSSPMLPRLGLLTWELFLCPITYLLSSPTSTMERERPRLTPTPWPRSLLVRLLEESSPMLEASPLFLIVLLLSTLPTIPTALPLSTTARQTDCYLTQDGKCQ